MPGGTPHLRPIDQNPVEFVTTQMLFDDLRYAFRRTVKNAGTSAAIVATLALGTGATIAVFSVFRNVLLSPLPFNQPDRLLAIWEQNPSNGVLQEAVSPANFHDWQKACPSIENMAAFTLWKPVLKAEGTSERLEGASLSANLIEMLGVSPLVGRPFLPQESEPGDGGRVVLLSHSLWRERFGADPDVIGRTVRIQEINQREVSYEVVGVMPRGFQFPRPLEPTQPEIWRPLSLNRHGATRKGHSYSVIARLKPGASMEQARRELDIVAARLQEEYPATNRGWRAAVVPLHEQAVGQSRKMFYLLGGAVALVLLIACVNIANLLAAQAIVRTKEIAIRAAMGASPSALWRQMLTESLALAVLGTALGLGIAYGALAVLPLLSPTDLPRLDGIRMEIADAVFAIALLVPVGLSFGLAPAAFAGRIQPHEAMKGEQMSLRGFALGRLRNTLVVFQLALALVLLVGAGLLLKSFSLLRSVPLAYDAGAVVTARVTLPGWRYAEFHNRTAFYESLTEKVASLPGVVAASAASDLPVQRTWAAEFRAVSRNLEGEAELRVVTPHFFRTMGTATLEGRLFTEMDTPGMAPVLIVNQAFVRRYFPDQRVLGTQLLIQYQGKEPYTVVGVVGDTHRFGFDSEPRPEIYLAFQQRPSAGMFLLVRTSGAASAVQRGLRSLVHAEDGDVIVEDIRTLEELRAEILASPRFEATVLGGFSILSLSLALVGVYGVISHTVSRRAHEIGVRRALGAEPRHVLSLVMRQALTLTIIGSLLGLLGALAVGRLLASHLYEVSPADPVTLGTTCVLLGSAALLAAYFPARRAAKVDPLTAIRHE